MAWNEPGGSGNKDPWGGNKNNEQGPPDLDEVVKKLQQKFGALFGGGNGPRSTDYGGGGNAGSIGFGLIAAIAVVVWAISGV